MLLSTWIWWCLVLDTKTPVLDLILVKLLLAERRLPTNYAFLINSLWVSAYLAHFFSLTPLPGT